VQELAREKAQEAGAGADRNMAQAAITRILDIQKRVNPDPAGWAIRDYIDHGRPW